MDIRTFFVTHDREKSADSVKGAAAQESIDSAGEESTVSVERPRTHSVALSSTLFPTIFSPQPSTAVHTYGLLICSELRSVRFLEVRSVLVLW